MTRPSMLSMIELQQLVESGDVDTVVVAFADMQGRLVGKRVAAEHFLAEVADHVVTLSSAEDLPGHGAAVSVRFAEDLAGGPAEDQA